MLKVKISDILSVVKETELFKNIVEEDNDYVQVPQKYILTNKELKLETLEDLYEALNILRYWGVKEIPKYIFDWIFENKKLFFNGEFKIFFDKFKDYPKTLELRAIASSSFTYKQTFHDRSYFNIRCNFYPDINGIQLACLCGYPDALKYLTSKGQKIDITSFHAVIILGFIDCLKYIVENKLIEIDENCLGLACIFNHLECVKYLHQKGAKLKCIVNGHKALFSKHIYTAYAVREVLYRGYYDTFTYIFENVLTTKSEKQLFFTTIHKPRYGFLSDKDKFSYKYVIELILQKRNFEFLKYLLSIDHVQNVISRNSLVTDIGIKILDSSAPRIFEYFFKTFDIGHIQKAVIISHCNKNEHLECLEIFLKSGFDVHRRWQINAAENGSYKLFECFVKFNPNYPGANFYDQFNAIMRKELYDENCLKCINIFIAQGFSITEFCDTFFNVTGYQKETYKSIKQYKFLVDHGVDLTSYKNIIYDVLVEYIKDKFEIIKYIKDKFEIIKYLVDLGCNIDETTFQFAVRGDEIEVLKLLHEKNCKYSDDIMSFALTKQNYFNRTLSNTIIDFLFENDYPCPSELYYHFIKTKQTDSLKKLYDKNAKYDEEMLYKCIELDNVEALQFFIEKTPAKADCEMVKYSALCTETQSSDVLLYLTELYIPYDLQEIYRCLVISDKLDELKIIYEKCDDGSCIYKYAIMFLNFRIMEWAIEEEIPFEMLRYYDVLQTHNCLGQNSVPRKKLKKLLKMIKEQPGCLMDDRLENF